jgi:hypothetical protein
MNLREAAGIHPVRSVTLPEGYKGVSGSSLGTGFARIFDSREEAEKHCDGRPFQEVRMRLSSSSTETTQ